MKIITSAFVCYLTLTLNAQDLKPFKSDKGKWGYKDQSGKEIVAAKYENAWDFSEGMAMVKNKKNKYGYIDEIGKEIIALQYDDASSFSEGLAKVKLNDKYGFIDKTGKDAIPLKYDEVGNFNEGLATVRTGSSRDEKYGTLKGGKWGFIDNAGNEIIAPKYDDAGNFSEGLAYVKLNKKYRFIDTKGNEITLLEYDDAGDFSEGLAKVRVGGYFDGKWGFIDKNGKEVIPARFEEASDFSNGLARVKLNGKSIDIDKTGSNEEERKKKEEEEAERKKKERQTIIDLAIAQSKRDTLAKKVLDFYNEQDQLLFTKVNSLNEYLRSSMPNTGAPIFNSQWPSISLEMKNNYCKSARRQLDIYSSKYKELVLPNGKNELYDKINHYIETVVDFISSCNAWADFISNRPDDAKDVDKQLEYLEVNQKAMKKSGDSIRLFIETYKKRNGL